jgi:2-polyprenyl-3-methyl-5-hydroxy-6-metoxy-1,4-benzoquinol methylase
MNPSEILGRALSDFHNGDATARIIVHSPDFDPDEQPVSYYFRGFSDMPVLEKEALGLSRGKVLDIGAGAGSHCLVLQNRGFDATGIELSSEACEIMKIRGVKNVINADIFDTVTAKFDTLLMLMNGIGLVHTIDGLSSFLKHIRNYMNPGGQLLFDSANLIYLFQEDGKEEALIDLNSRYFGEIEFVMEYKGMKSDSFFWLYVDFDTLCHYTEQEGFKPELIRQDQNFQYLARLQYF